jgi:ATP-dependent DNA ligase
MQHPAGRRRTGDDFAERLPPVAEAIRALNVKSCLIDGEAIVTNADGPGCAGDSP